MAPHPHATQVDDLAAFDHPGILTTQLWRRILLLLTPPSAFPARYRFAGGNAAHAPPLRPARVHAYTLLQLLMLGLCWAVNLSPAGLCVSFVVVALVPLRERLLPRLFSPAELEALDTRAGGAFAAGA